MAFTGRARVGCFNSSSGLAGWMLYSGDWEHTHYPKREYYGYMTRPFRLTLGKQVEK